LSLLAFGRGIVAVGEGGIKGVLTIGLRLAIVDFRKNLVVLEGGKMISAVVAGGAVVLVI